MSSQRDSGICNRATQIMQPAPSPSDVYSMSEEYLGPERRSAEGEAERRVSSDRRLAPGQPDRRAVIDRRSGMERRRGPGRRRCEVRRTAEEGEISGELLEFIMAIDEYKRVNERPFPSWSEVFEIIQYLGYRKVAAKADHINNACGPEVLEPVGAGAR